MRSRIASTSVSLIGFQGKAEWATVGEGVAVKVKVASEDMDIVGVGLINPGVGVMIGAGPGSKEGDAVEDGVNNATSGRRSGVIVAMGNINVVVKLALIIPSSLPESRK
jgi:hypothetical protein